MQRPSASSAGSSPRVRRTSTLQRRGSQLGSSPRVRRTYTHSPFELAAGSSPRVRGTFFLFDQHLDRQPDGSSPRVRGTYRAGIHENVFIPAVRIRGLPDSSVHPRVCGEHRSSAAPTGRSTPVHPRVCGEHVAVASLRSVSQPVHPRVCGEHDSVAMLLRLAEVMSRFIPACAGNIVHQARNGGSSPRVRGTFFHLAMPCLALAVHPRVCGEH